MMIVSLMTSKLTREQMMLVKGGGDDDELGGDSKCYSCTKDIDCSPSKCTFTECNKVAELCVAS